MLAAERSLSVPSYREVTECNRFWAEGSGRSVALGAMHATYNLYDDAEQIAMAGVHAASDFDKSTGLPAQVCTVDLR